MSENIFRDVPTHCLDAFTRGRIESVIRFGDLAAAKHPSDALASIRQCLIEHYQEEMRRSTILPVHLSLPDHLKYCEDQIKALEKATWFEQHAPLIAAAPELLEVLEDVEVLARHDRGCAFKDGPCTCGYEEWWARYCAVTAKAKGRT